MDESSPAGGADVRPPRIFVSALDAEDVPVTDLVRALREAGAEVDHSPADGDDPRFYDWYDVGLPAAVRHCEAFVIVPITWWDSSTWMMIEADTAMRRVRSDPEFHFCAWRPRGYRNARITPGNQRYLESAPALPRDPHEAAALLVKRVTLRISRPSTG